MKSAILTLAAVLVWASPAKAERYRVKDSGGFASTGRFIEFADQYGWESYSVDFDFGLDMANRRLSDGSTLTLAVKKKDGSRWSYRCRADDEQDPSKREMWANINMLYGSGISVLAECRVSARKFSKAVDLDWDLVGEPTLVFHVLVQDGKARAGVQKGMYFLSAAQIEAGSMNQYASKEGDPSELGLLFASESAPYLPPRPQLAAAAAPRLVP